MGETLFEKVWNRHVVEQTDEATLLYIDRHLLHEVTSPQAFEGLQAGGAAGAQAGLDIRDGRSQRTDGQSACDCRPAVAAAGRGDAGQLPGVRNPLYDIASGRQGIVHVIGPELGLTLPGMTDRLRRQPHEHTRGLRCAGVWDRHQRGRARTGDADALAGTSAGIVWNRGDRAPRPRAGAEGHHSGDHPQDRHRRRDRACDRVLRAGDQGTFDGRADDDLQHVDRGRSACRADRARRRDDRLHHAGRATVRPSRGCS